MCAYCTGCCGVTRKRPSLNMPPEIFRGMFINRMIRISAGYQYITRNGSFSSGACKPDLSIASLYNDSPLILLTLLR